MFRPACSLTLCRPGPILAPLLGATIPLCPLCVLREAPSSSLPRWSPPAPSSGPLSGQTAPARERVLYVSAVDDKGEPVADLGPDAFVVREEGARREVLRVSRATEPIDIALLVDNSAAIRDMVTLVREGVSAFVTRMAPRNKSPSSPSPIDPPSSWTTPTTRSGSATGSGGCSPPAERHDAARRHRRNVARPGAARGTAGRDRRRWSPTAPSSPTAIPRTWSRSSSTPAPRLHVVGVGQFLHSEENGIRERSFLLDEGPRTSGGQRILLLSPIGIEPALERLARELSSQYKVVYARPQSLIAPEKIEIASARPGITMRGAPERRQDGGGR